MFLLTVDIRQLLAGVVWRGSQNALDGMRGDGVITLLPRAGMMASRLYHRKRVIPALTDHLEDKGGVIGIKKMAMEG